MKKVPGVYTFSIASAFIFSIASALLLFGILAIGFQTRSMADVLTLGGAFNPVESVYDIIFTFVVPLFLLLGFAFMAFRIILNLKRLN